MTDQWWTSISMLDLQFVLSTLYLLCSSWSCPDSVMPSIRFKTCTLPCGIEVIQLCHHKIRPCLHNTCSVWSKGPHNTNTISSTTTNTNATINSFSPTLHQHHYYSDQYTALVPTSKPTPTPPPPGPKTKWRPTIFWTTCPIFTFLALIIQPRI